MIIRTESSRPELLPRGIRHRLARTHPFLSTTGSSANFLHIDTTVATQLESGGVTGTGIADDFDGNARGTPHRISVQMNLSGILLDLTPPAIFYTSCSVTRTAPGTRTLTATITDASGVPTAGAGLPVLYWKINAGSYTAATGAFIGSNQYQFTFGSGVVAGDIVSYYIVAQDNAGTPNVGSNPSAGASGFTANPPAAATPPTTPSGYTIVPSFSGNKNVGVGGDYTTLTAAVTALNGSEITGPVTLTLTDATYPSETFPITINANSGSNATNTVTIKPGTGVTSVVSGSSATTIIDLSGAKFVIIDGSNSGGATPNSPSGDLTIRNTNNAGLATIRLINDASNNTIQRSVIEGGITSASGGLVFIAAGLTTGNDNNTISGNIVRDRTDVAGVPANLVVSLNGSTTATNSNNVVTGNQLMNFTANGFATSSGATSDNWTVTNNDISQNATRAATVFGINTGGMTGTNNISGNSIHGFISSSSSSILGFLVGNSQNLTISKNRIFDFQTSAAATGTIEGIEYDGASGATPNITVTNNFVTLAPTLATAQVVIGIQDFGFGGNVFNAFYNSIYVGGTASGSASSWALRRGTAAPTTYTAKNNLCFNNRTGGTGSHFAGGDQSANTGTFVSDYNFYAGTGATAANFMDYGTSSSGTAVSFTTWKAGPPARDANSIANTAATYTVGTFFVNAATSDLHLGSSGQATLDRKAITGTGVTTDIDGNTRNTNAPDIGADEVNLPGVLQFSVATNTVGEGAGSLVMNVTRTGGSDGSVGVVYNPFDGTAMSPGDYTCPSGNLSWADGDTANKTITATIVDDNVDEPSQDFTVTLSAPSGGATIGTNVTATNTITDNDSPPTFTISDVTQAEGSAGPNDFTFTVTKNGATEFVTSIDYLTQDGSAFAPGDYTAITQTTLTFQPNETTKQVMVSVNGDMTYENNETFTVALTNQMSAGEGINIPHGFAVFGTGTIQNDDSQPSFAINDVTMNEGNSGPTSFIFTVTKTGSTALNSSVNFQTIDGSATLGDNDYQTNSGLLTFGPADTMMQVTVTVNGDTTVEPNENFTVELSNASDATIGDNSGTGTITNDDVAAPPTFSIDDVTMNEGDAGQTSFVFTVTKGGTGAANVDFQTMNGTATTGNNDYVTNSGTLTFGPTDTIDAGHGAGEWRYNART